MALPTYEIEVTERECPRPDGTAMLMRISRPNGSGPFPAVVDIHGGGWVSGDRKQNAIIDDYLAARGIVAVAPEFRMPPAAVYPVPVSDVHLAIRWLKANAASLHVLPQAIGGVGTSSGGHQLLLAALRPSDARYGAARMTALDGIDATLRYLVLGWPVADPLRRFHMAREKGIANLLDAHAAYWPDEAAMAEGNPQSIVARGLHESLPPLLLLQGTNDNNLPPDMASRFVSAYRKAGGDATLREFADQPHTFVTRDPASESSKQALAAMAEFIHAQAAADLRR
jgi:acetyl esterase/lipase